MKLTKTILTGLFLFISFFGKMHAQQYDNSAIEYLIGNKVKAAVLNGGDFFWDRTNGQFFAPYSLEAESLPTTIFASALWLAGFNESGQLKTACQRLGNNTNLDNKRHEFWPGPIDKNSQMVFPDGCENFDFIWKTYRGDILQVLNDYADDGLINQAVPVSILNWPGRGNPHFEGAMGFTLPDQELAPFFDRNGNGLYEPLEGDYPTLDPALLDVVPDEMTWCVFNDIQDVHGETGGLPLGVEVHFMVYAFNCSENEVLNHTVFTRHKIFNKSAEDLHGFKAAFWTDFDIGCYEDDAFACDTILNSQYFYNNVRYGLNQAAIFSSLSIEGKNTRGFSSIY